MDEETEVWIECDRCGRAYGGPGVLEAVRRLGWENVCAECLAGRGYEFSELQSEANRTVE
jgi:hypothetical protein